MEFPSLQAQIDTICLMTNASKLKHIRRLVARHFLNEVQQLQLILSATDSWKVEIMKALQMSWIREDVLSDILGATMTHVQDVADHCFSLVPLNSLSESAFFNVLVRLPVNARISFFEEYVCALRTMSISGIRNFLALMSLTDQLRLMSMVAHHCPRIMPRIKLQIGEHEFGEKTLEIENHSRIQKNEPECVVCMNLKSNGVFVPCGHKACCQTCASKLRLCPICRTITSWVKIYEVKIE